MTPFRVEVPATSANLGPGFDTFGIALDICNTVTCTPDSSRDSVVLESVEGEPIGDFDPARNLLCGGYRAWGEATGGDLPGMRFHLDSRIPVGKGFGSSAAAIVAGLAAAAHAAGEKHPRERLLSLSSAMEGHPDNAVAAVLGGVTVAFMDDEGTHALHVVTHLGLSVVLYLPDDPLLTVEARGVLPTEVPLRDAVFNINRAAYLATALAWGRWELLGPAMEDRLHQTYRGRLIPALHETMLAARGAGAFGAALSGGGPSVLAFAPSEVAEGVARAMDETACERGWNGHSTITGVRHLGVRVTNVE